MTGYTVHTGSNDKFRQGWDNVFKPKNNRAPTKKNAGKDADKKKQPKPR